MLLSCGHPHPTPSNFFSEALRPGVGTCRGRGDGADEKETGLRLKKLLSLELKYFEYVL